MNAQTINTLMDKATGRTVTASRVGAEAFVTSYDPETGFSTYTVTADEAVQQMARLFEQGWR